MFTGRVVFNDFIFSTLLVGAMLWIGVALPAHLALDVSWSTIFAFLPVVLTLYFVWNYLLHFKWDVSLSRLVLQTILGIVALLPISTHLDLLLVNFGENPVNPDSFDAILNTSYAATVLLLGGILGYTTVFLKLPIVSDFERKVVHCWTTDLDLYQHAYLSPAGVSRLKPIFIGFGAFGIILIFPLLQKVITTHDTELVKLLIMRVATMSITLIVYTVSAVSIGEAIRLIQLQQRIGKGPFKVYDFDERLRWRHDYVKYHLPAPIRKLNLRLFNQHVEAYERLQKQAKASRT